MISFLKKIALAIFALLAIVWMGKNWLFNHFFSYKTDSIISAQLIENQEVASENVPNFSTDSLFRETLNETSDALRFSFEKCSNDPVQIVQTGRANCVGYSAFFKKRLEEKLAAAGSLADFKIEHLRGRLHFWGQDIHRFSKSKFWKDHDFVAVRQLSTGAEWVVDPSLYDFFGVGFCPKKGLN